MVQEHWLIGRFPAFARRRLRSVPQWAIEACLFVLVGGAQLVVDWAMYVALSYLGCAILLANVAARLTGAALGLWLNRKVTFPGDDGRLARKHFGRFAVFWVIATLLSTAALAFAKARFGIEASWMVKPVVEGLLAVVSFLVSRHWIYR